MPYLPTRLIAGPSAEMLEAQAAALMASKDVLTGMDRTREDAYRLPADVPRRFLGDELLAPARPLPPSPDSRGLIGEIARQLGHAVSERYGWDRPLAIKADGIAEVLASPRLRAHASAYWQLQADAKGETVLLVIKAGGERVAAAPVLDLRTVPTGMVVLNVDEGLEGVQADLSNRFNGMDWTEGPLSLPLHLKEHASSVRPLQGLPSNMRIMILGHGGRSAWLPGLLGRPYAADRVGGKSAAAMADHLVKLGLEKSYAGTLYLEACDSAAGFSNGSSYAQQLQRALVKRGYAHVAIAGTPGVTSPQPSGHNYSDVSALANDYRRGLKQSSQAIERLKGQLATPSPQAPLTRQQRSGIEKAVRQEQQHRRALQQLQQVARLEKAKAITPDQADIKRKGITGVRDWWGHLGARSTSAPAPVAAASPRSWFSRQWHRLFGGR